MKDENLSPPQYLLFSGFGRELISSLYGKPKDSVWNIYADSDKEKISKEKILNFLEEKRGLKILQKFFLDAIPADADDSYPDRLWASKIQIVDDRKIKVLTTIFSDSLILEPYGIEKQIRIVKNVLRRKFIELENEEIHLDWEDIFENYRNHLNLLKTIFILENEDFLKITNLSFQLRIREIVDMVEGEEIWGDGQYGLCFIDAKVKISNKLLGEWLEGDYFKKLSVAFNKTNGVLTVMGNSFQFCNSNDVPSVDLMALLVENLGERVDYPSMAKIVLGLTSERLKEKYKTEKKSPIHNQVKNAINTLRNKIAKLGLDKTLRIESCKGYSLVLVPSSEPIIPEKEEIVKYLEKKEQAEMVKAIDF